MSDWKSLLVLPQGAAETRRFRVLEKPGHFFIYVPPSRRAAHHTLDLYSAQRLRARFIRGAARFLLRWRIPLPHAPVKVPISLSTPFAQFMLKLARGVDGSLPVFGVMASYLREDDHRYMFLLFDSAEHPRVVVKVGTSPRSREAVRRELSFFQPLPLQRPGMPHLIYHYSESDAEAVAYIYEDGQPLTWQDDTARLSALLSSWVWHDQSCLISDLERWKQMEAIGHQVPRLKPLLDKVGQTRVRPVIGHGDFIAWNIRVNADGNWRVLDWENAERIDIPAWDWFHFITGYHLGVRLSTAKEVTEALVQTWHDPHFLAYADLTGIRSVIPELTVLYLHYASRFCGLPERLVRQPADEIMAHHC